MASALARLYAGHDKMIPDEALQMMGALIMDAAGCANDLEQAKETAGQMVLPVIIRSRDPQIISLPWETLYHQKYGFIGRSDGFTLSRQVPGQKTALPPIEKGPVRVLLFTSLPDDLSEQGRLDVEEEQAYVQEALAPLERDGLVILEMPDDGGLRLSGIF